MKVQTKLFVLFVTALIAFNALLIFLDYTEKKKLVLIYDDERNQRNVFFDKLMSLKGGPLELIVHDYSFWDEMVNFVGSADAQWAKDNLDALLGSAYSFNAVWVYRPDFSLTYSVGNIAGGEFKEIPIPPEALAQLFSKGEFCHFYLNTFPGVLEIRGATIHPSSDREHQTPGQGYFFAGRLWDQKYFQELSQLTDSSVSIVPGGDPDPTMDKKDQQEGIILVTRTLPSWDGTLLVRLNARSKSSQIVDYHDQSRRNLIALEIFAWTLFLIVIVLILFWVSFPLRRISRTMADEDPIHIVPLLKNRTEFGKIAQLIDKFFHDKGKILEEIEERKNPQKILNEQFIFLQNLLDTIPNPIFYKNTEGRYLGCNKAMEYYLGLTKKGIVGKTVFDVLPEELAQQHLKEDGELFRVGGTQICESEFPAIDGTRRSAMINKATYVDTNGAIIGLVGVVQDISERKQIESQLHLQGVALETAANAIVITDAQGTTLWVNRAFTQLTGYGAHEIIGKNPRILKSGKQEAAFYQDLWWTILSGKVWRGEVINRRKDGSYYTEEMTVTPVHNDQGQITHFIAIKQDVTERKNAADQLSRTLADLEAKNQELQRTQAQLLQSEKMAAVGQLSAGVAHEIKNPLAIIILSVEQLEKNIVGANSQNKVYLDMVKRAAERADKVIVELLNFSRFSTIELESVSLHAIIDSAIMLADNSAKQKKIEIRREYSEDVGEIVVDKILMEQVFLNLVANAIDAIEQGGTITFKTYLKQHRTDPIGRVIIEVSDTGSGMPPAVSAKIFEPFFTTKEPGKGTGLGLSTVYMILEKHDGSILVESKEGVGTKFMIILPSKPEGRNK